MKLFLHFIFCPLKHHTGQLKPYNMLQFQRETKPASEYVNSVKDSKDIKIPVCVDSHVMLTCLPVSYVYSHNVFDGNKLQSISSQTFLILTFFTSPS